MRDGIKFLWAFTAMAFLLSGAALRAGADVGIYAASSAGGRTAGAGAIKNTLEEAGIAVEEFSRLSLENLLKYGAVIIPNTRELARGEDPRWTDNLRAYVAEAGGALVFCHDAIGAERSPFGIMQLFPEIVMPGTVERQEASGMNVVLDRAYFRDFDYLPGYESGESAEHMYFDRFVFAQTGGTPVLADPESGKTIVGTGEVGKGRVVFNGTFGGHPETHTAWELEGIDRDVMVNTVRWALAGGGPFAESPGELEVAEWSPRAEVPEGRHRIAVVFAEPGGGMNRRVVEENVRRAGISYDYIPFNFLAIRGLERDDYPLAILFLPEDPGEPEVKMIESYLESGGKAIIFLPNNWRRPGAMQRLLDLFSVEFARLHRNTFRPEVWGRYRRIVFSDPGFRPAKIENLPRLLAEIRVVSEESGVTAYWEDITGGPGIPAVIRHEHGYLFNNNSFGDLHNLRMFMAVAASELLPEAGAGICGNLLEVYRERVAEVAPEVSGREGNAYLREAARLERRASAAAARGNYTGAIAYLVEADEKLVYAFAASMESVPGEERMVFTVDVTDPQETAERFARAGLNGIVFLRLADEYPAIMAGDDEGRVILREWIEAVRLKNLKYGVSIAPFSLRAGTEIHSKAVEEDWRIVPPEAYGEPRPSPAEAGGRIAVCRSRREVGDHAIAAAAAFARDFAPDYIMFDGIRWPSSGGGMNYCVCDYCREHFRKDTGITVENWPGDVMGKHLDAFHDWRASHVTRIVRETGEQVRKIDPGIKTGVFTRPPGANISEGQYWWEWGEDVDFMMPMTYTDDLAALDERMTEMNRRLEGAERAALTPCVIAPGARIADPLTWLRQIQMQRESAPAGMIFFHYAFFSDPLIELLGIGPYRER